MIKPVNRLNTVGPVKVGSLKSQLHLRPSYDDLLKETLVEDENRPSIENVIDRRARRYRLNQYGSQFDKDALDIQKKEELSRREEVKKEASSGRVDFDELDLTTYGINKKYISLNNNKYDTDMFPVMTQNKATRFLSEKSKKHKQTYQMIKKRKLMTLTIQV